MGERRVMQETLFYGFSLERHVPARPRLHERQPTSDTPDPPLFALQVHSPLSLHSRTAS